MPRFHTVSQGEGISSLSERYGFAPETIWEHPENARIRALREDPNVLLPGDVVCIPDKQPKFLEGATNARHRFRRKGVPAMFELQLLDGDRPIAGVPYVLAVSDQRLPGTTDGQGILRHYVPNAASKGWIEYTENGKATRLELNFGCLDPITEIVGVQKRLNNLGFPCGEPDGTLNSATSAALLLFQFRAELEPTGVLDEVTREKLRIYHDSPEAMPPVHVEGAS